MDPTASAKNRALALSDEDRRRMAQHAANVRWGTSEANDIKYVHAVVDADIKRFSPLSPVGIWVSLHKFGQRSRHI
jgi:hypothetical protein